MRWQNLTSSDEKNDNGNRVSYLEADATTTDNSLESVVTSENNKPKDEIDDQYACECAEGNVESIADLGEPRREREGRVPGHTPGKSRRSGVCANNNEVLRSLV